MNELKLESPAPRLLMEYLQGCKENWEHVHDRYILHDPNKFDTWKDTIFTDYENHFKGINLPEGFVPNATFWLTLEGHYAGTINIRLRLTPRLQIYGGHAGIVIRNSMRGRGLGSRAFPLTLNKTHELGIHPTLFTCTESNTISMKTLHTIQSLKHERDLVQVNGILQPIHRFWF